MSDKLTIGNVVIQSPPKGGVLHACQKCGVPGATLFFPGGYLCPDCAHPAPAPPKPPKRVAVRASLATVGGITVRLVVANDGTLWEGERGLSEWTRLPDLPQE